MRQHPHKFPPSAMTQRRLFPTNMPSLRNLHGRVEEQLDASRPWLKRNPLTWRRSSNGKCVRGVCWRVNVELSVCTRKNLQREVNSATDVISITSNSLVCLQRQVCRTQMRLLQWKMTYGRLQYEHNYERDLQRVRLLSFVPKVFEHCRSINNRCYNLPPTELQVLLRW